MSAPPISDEVLRHTVEAWWRHERAHAPAAAELGVTTACLSHRLRTASKRGLMIRDAYTGKTMPGFEIANLTTVTDKDGNVVRTSMRQRPERGPKFELPPGQAIGRTTLHLDADGHIIEQWPRVGPGERDPVEMARLIKEALNGIDAAPPVDAPCDAETDICNLIPLSDWHIGLHTWGREVGENWDLKIAEQRISASMDRVLARAPVADTGIVLGGGDLTHNDDRTNATPASKHQLQVDGRYPLVLQTAIRLVAHTIDRALLRHKRVIVRVLEGNHDPHAHVAVTYAMVERYRLEPRVEVDCDPSLFWCYPFGKVMLAATHGHTLKGHATREMPSLMATLWPAIWGATRHWYAHTFHLHHKEKQVDENGGVETRVHQAPIPRDVYAFGKGYVAGRSLGAITYHRESGYRGEAVEALG